MVGARLPSFCFSLAMVTVMGAAIPAAEVLFVGGAAEPTLGDDEFVFDHLVENLGHNVTYLAAGQATTEDGEAADLVVISSTSGTRNVRGKYPDIETPILQWNEALIPTTVGNFNMADVSGNGSEAPFDTITIREPDHPIIQLAGLDAGEVTVYDDFNNLVWARDLSPDTVGIASHGEHRVLWVLSAVEAGRELTDGQFAAGARVNFFIEDTGFSNLTEDGLALFDSSIAWLLGEDDLQAGDADQDFDFDQFDLVSVQIANKYLSGQIATWGEGDWDGAPGGEQGNPPPGDGMFDQGDIIAALSAGFYLTGPYRSRKQDGTEGDGRTSPVYDPVVAGLKVNGPAGTDLKSINVIRADGESLGEKRTSSPGALDSVLGDHFLKATLGDSFGNALPATGIDEVTFAADMLALGSLAVGGELGDVDLAYVPEPTAHLLALLATLGVLGTFRRR